jgi:A/G-specific adenine glycosylase
MRERTYKDVWAGMYDFYLKEFNEQPDAFEQIIQNDTFLENTLREAVISRESEVYTHVLTHQRIYTKYWHLVIDTDYNIALPFGMQWYSLDEVDDLPKSTLVNNYLTDFVF